MSEFYLADVIIASELRRAGLSDDALTSPLRFRTIGTVRQKLIKRLRTETDMSWREIAYVLGLKPTGRILTRKSL
ncbi:hypothetical protein ES703_92936 [subsurface metagenome]